MACLNCGGNCGHPRGMHGVTGSILFVRDPWTQAGMGELVQEGENPWDTSRWTVTEWAAAAGLVASLVWVWSLTMGKRR